MREMVKAIVAAIQNDQRPAAEMVDALPKQVEAPKPNGVGVSG